MAAAIGTAAALVTIVAYVDLWDTEGYFESGGYETRIIRRDIVHIGNSPGKFDYTFFPSPHNFSFDLPGIDRGQMAVLTFQVADQRSTRHMELNGTLLPVEPQIRNSGFDTWDTVFITVDKGILRSSGNELRIVTLDNRGGTSGDVDDVLFRNIAILYRSQ